MSGPAIFQGQQPHWLVASKLAMVGPGFLSEAEVHPCPSPRTRASRGHDLGNTVRQSDLQVDIRNLENKIPIPRGPFHPTQAIHSWAHKQSSLQVVHWVLFRVDLKRSTLHPSSGRKL